MLRADNLRTAHLGPLSISVAAGEIVGLRGASGAGKSLLLRALADLDVSSGHVTLDGRLRETIPAPLWRRRVALVPAESGWWEDRVRPHFAADMAAAAEAIIKALGLPGEVMGWEIARLSTGERQRLALARALVGRPEALLLDEPTSGLDAESRDRAEAAILAERDRGAAILVVTHEAAQAGRLADRVIQIEDGRLVEAA